MSYRITLSPIAKDHTQDAYEYYESQQLFLGDQFLTTLEMHYDELSVHPQHYSFITDKKIYVFLSWISSHLLSYFKSNRTMFLLLMCITRIKILTNFLNGFNK